MEKLGQLYAEAQEDGTYDLIVVDTPPSRSALDFLDAPERLSSFLDGKFVRLMLAPARGPARLVSAGFGMVTSALTKMIGAQFLKDLQTFIAAIETVFGGGFRQRAQQTYSLLQARQAAFLVVAAPEPDALREASYFVDRLAAERMPLRGLVVNRATAVHPAGLSAAASTAAAERLRENGADLTAGLMDLHARRELVAARQAALRQRFAAGHPAVPTVVVPALASDVHDLDGLREVGELMAQAEA